MGPVHRLEDGGVLNEYFSLPVLAGGFPHRLEDGGSLRRRVAEELGSKRARGRATNGSERLALLAVGKLPVPARDLLATRSHKACAGASELPPVTANPGSG